MTETQTKPETTSRIVRALFATYESVEEDALGNLRVVVRTADRGTPIEVSESEAARLDALDALEAPGVTEEQGELERQRRIEDYRAERGDSTAVEAVIARGINPLDNTGARSSAEPPISVSPPGMGAEPRGTLLTGDTGAPDTPAPEAAGPESVVRLDAPDPRDATVAELAAWIESESPNVGDTVALAEGEPDLAAKLLEAERAATQGDPRRGVEERLSKIADTE